MRPSRECTGRVLELEPPEPRNLPLLRAHERVSTSTTAMRTARRRGGAHAPRTRDNGVFQCSRMTLLADRVLSCSPCRDLSPSPGFTPARCAVSAVLTLRVDLGAAHPRNAHRSGHGVSSVGTGASRRRVHRDRQQPAHGLHCHARGCEGARVEDQLAQRARGGSGREQRHRARTNVASPRRRHRGRHYSRRRSGDVAQGHTTTAQRLVLVVSLLHGRDWSTRGDDCFCIRNHGTRANSRRRAAAATHLHAPALPERQHSAYCAPSSPSSDGLDHNTQRKKGQCTTGSSQTRCRGAPADRARNITGSHERRADRDRAQGG